MPMKGWRGELERHALASKGIKTTGMGMKRLKDYKVNLDKVIVVDIDGTLFDTRERWKKALEVAKPPSPTFWNAFMSDDFIKLDKPIKNSARVLHYLVKEGYKIIYLSGRRKSLMLDTEIAFDHANLPEGEIILRPKGMSTEDFKVREMRRLNMENNVIMSIGDSNSDKYVALKTTTPYVMVLQNNGWDNIILDRIKGKIPEEEE